MKTSKLTILLFAFFLLYFITGCQEKDETYRISFITETDMSFDDQIISYLEDLVLPELSKEGFTFTGWTYTSNSETHDISELIVLISDLELHAQWEVNDYVLTFQTFSDDTIDPITYTYQSHMLIDFVPEKEGYFFDGWYLDSTYNQPFILEVMPSYDFTLYAKWNINQYQILFDSNCSLTIDPMIYTYGDEINLPIDLNLEGYHFLGWYLDEELTIPFTDESIVSSLTLYAKWEVIQYELTIHSLHTPNTEQFLVNYGQVIDLDQDLLFEGYSFVGWYLDADYLTSLDLTHMPSYNLDIYAKWEINTYNISFNTNTDELLESLELSYGYPIIINYEIYKEGYTFNNWYLDQELTEVFFYETMPAQNLELYAKWEINYYVINLVIDSSHMMDPLYFAYQEEIILPDQLFKEGYDFIGWYYNLELSILMDIIVMPANDLTIYAKWLPKSYQITYYDFNQEISYISEQYYDEIIELPMLTMDHYILNGWFYDVDLLDPVLEFDLVTDHLSLYPNWTQKNFSDYIEEAKTATYYKISYYRIENLNIIYTSQRQDDIYKFSNLETNDINYVHLSDHTMTYYYNDPYFDFYQSVSYIIDSPENPDSFIYDLLHYLNPEWFIEEDGVYVFYESLFYNDPAESFFDGKISGKITLTDQGFMIETSMSEHDIEYFIVDLYDLDPIELPTDAYVLQQNEDFDYYVIDDEIFLERYIGSNPNLMIPEFIDDKPVVAIGNHFSNLYLQSLSIPKTIKFIANDAFNSQSGLIVLDIPLDHQLEYIGNNAFFNVNLILFLPSGINFIGQDAFHSAQILFTDEEDTSLWDPRWNGDHQALMYVRSLHETDDFYYTLQENYEIYILKSKANQQEIFIPRMLDGYLVTTIHAYAFYHALVTMITFDTDMELRIIGEYAFSRINLNQEIIIPSSVETIGQYAFSASGITSLRFEEGAMINYIGDYAFYVNQTLLSIYLPAGIDYIGQSICAYTSSKLYIDETDKNPNWHEDYIDSNQIVLWNLLESYITIDEIIYQIINPSEVMVIGHELTVMPYEITIPEQVTGYQVTKIGAYAFSSDPIGSFILPSSITHIYNRAFGYNSNLTDFNFEDLIHLEYIGNYAFFGTSLSEVHLPEALRYIGLYAFSQVDMDILTFSLSGSLEIIEYRAFETYRHSVQLPTTIEYINAYAFQNARQIFIPHLENQTSWASSINYFGNHNIYYGILSYEENDDFGYGITIDQEITIFSYMGHSTDVIIPHDIGGLSVTSLHDFSFRLSMIDSIFIPNTVQTLGSFVFQESTVRSVVFEQGSLIKEIPNAAFMNATQLININLEALNQLEIIHSQAFNSTSMLGDLIIPSTVKEIHEGAFSDSGVSSITFQENSQLQKIEHGAFSHAYNLVQFNAEHLEYLSYIGHQAFSATSSLTTFIIPMNVKVIGMEAFSSSGITIIYIQANEIPRTWFMDWNRYSSPYELGYKDI